MDFTHKYKDAQHEKLKQKLEDLDMPVDELLSLHTLGWQNIFRHGDFQRWSSGLEALPDRKIADVALKKEVRIGDSSSCDASVDDLTASLQAMHPWRKGPFQLFGVHIDTEWHSDWKWERVLPHISPLKGRAVLDIGCGSGYHLWRMMGEGADFALGIDPTPLFSLHFATIKRYQPDTAAFLIPTGIDEMPKTMQSFDTVFSMGILYHRREPLEHLYKIKSLLKEGGELVLETLVVDGDERTCLVPDGRYAKMRNVWFIPSVAMLMIWLKRVGFRHVSCVDVSQTTIEEQRATSWMRFESLSSFLDAEDMDKTIEGYPAPKRAVIVAQR